MDMYFSTSEGSCECSLVACDVKRSQHFGQILKIFSQKLCVRVLEGFRLQDDRLLVGRVILVSGEIFFIFMIMNKKKTENSAQISRKSEICALFAFF